MAATEIWEYGKGGGGEREAEEMCGGFDKGKHFQQNTDRCRCTLEENNNYRNGADNLWTEAA